MKVGIMTPWPTPNYRWEQIAMDFILGLPLTKRQHNSCLVVVYRLSKQVHYIPTKDKVSAQECAQLLFKDDILGVMTLKTFI